MKTKSKVIAPTLFLLAIAFTGKVLGDDDGGNSTVIEETFLPIVGDDTTPVNAETIDPILGTSINADTGAPAGVNLNMSSNDTNGANAASSTNYNGTGTKVKGNLGSNTSSETFPGNGPKRGDMCDGYGNCDYGDYSVCDGFGNCDYEDYYDDCVNNGNCNYDNYIDLDENCEDGQCEYPLEEYTDCPFGNCDYANDSLYYSECDGYGNCDNGTAVYYDSESEEIDSDCTATGDCDYEAMKYYYDDSTCEGGECDYLYDEYYEEMYRIECALYGDCDYENETIPSPCPGGDCYYEDEYKECTSGDCDTIEDDYYYESDCSLYGDCDYDNEISLDENCYETGNCTYEDYYAEGCEDGSCDYTNDTYDYDDCRLTGDCHYKLDLSDYDMDCEDGLCDYEGNFTECDYYSEYCGYQGIEDSYGYLYYDYGVNGSDCGPFGDCRYIDTYYDEYFGTTQVADTEFTRPLKTHRPLTEKTRKQETGKGKGKGKVSTQSDQGAGKGTMHMHAYKTVLEMPYTVRIYSIYEVEVDMRKFLLKKRKNFTCTGSLVSRDYVLTAAHCFDLKRNYKDDVLSLVRIVVYVGQLNPKELTVPTENIFLHPCKEDGPTGEYDIALLFLPYSLLLNDDIQVVELTKDTDLVEKHFDKGSLYATAWAWAQDKKAMFRAKMEIISNNDCLAYSPSFKYFKYFCARVIDVGRPEVVEFGCGARSGGNGGPLVYNNGTNIMQIGILITPYRRKKSECDNFEWPVRFLKVQMHLVWIWNVLNPGFVDESCDEYPSSDFEMYTTTQTPHNRTERPDEDIEDGALDPFKQISYVLLGVILVANTCFAAFIV